MNQQKNLLSRTTIVRRCLLFGLACLFLFGACSNGAKETTADAPLIAGDDSDLYQWDPFSASSVVATNAPADSAVPPTFDPAASPNATDGAVATDEAGNPIVISTPPSESASPATSLLGGKTYQKGDTDEIIAGVQETLMHLGYMDSDEPTEYFGSNTRDALLRFQLHNGLKQDGIIGEAVYALLTGGSAKEYVMQLGDEGDDVQEVQDRLYELGYLDKSSRTGTFGEKTSAAVVAFQTANSLEPDGKVGEKTQNQLYSSDVVGNYYKYGDTDSTIVAYQTRLIKLGYLDDDYEAKGKMDGSTVTAIKNFQDANGLVRDGCLGPATMEQINSADAVKYALRLGMSGSTIKSMQKLLYGLGYLKSSQVTGYFGEVTETAVKTFQKRNSLTQDGAVGSKTLAKLGSSSAVKAQTTTNNDKDDDGGSGGSGGSGGTTTSSGVEKFISIAKGKIGCKYVRGAKGSNSFDCSGFVYWCLNQAGVKQGYMTSIAWRTCSKYKRITSMSSLKRGDVLVFKGSSMATGHVGIYLGDGQMIDASSGAGQVRITKTVLTGNYWKSHFLMAYRIWD